MPFGLSLGCGAPGLIAIATTFYGTRMRGTGIGRGMAMGRFGQVIVQAIGQLMQFVAVVPIAVAGAVLAARAFAKRSTVAAQVEAAQPSS